LYTAKQSIKYASEHIEVFGGLGYLEDSGIPAMLRDVQTLSIWEGTTNVLSLDMLRAAEKENGLQAFHAFATNLLNSCQLTETVAYKETLQKKANALFAFIQNLKTAEERVAAARDVAFYVAELTIALLWLEFLQTNYSKANYANTLHYLLQFSMNESSLQSAAQLGLV
jgi:putative acyl-CoA dehydrogenase